MKILKHISRSPDERITLHVMKLIPSLFRVTTREKKMVYGFIMSMTKRASPWLLPYFSHKKIPNWSMVGKNQLDKYLTLEWEL